MDWVSLHTLSKGAFTKDVRPTPPRGGSENPDKTGLGGGRGGLRCSDVRNWKNYIRSFLVIFVGNHISVRKFLLPGNCEYVIMCLSAYTCSCSDFHTMGNQKIGRPTGEGGCKLSDNPGQTGEGGSENLDFGRTSFVNGP